jgi:hypothetical protein
MTTKGKSLADLTARVDMAAAARPISPPAPTVEPASTPGPRSAAEAVASPPTPNPPARPAEPPPERPASIPSPYSLPHRTRRYTAELPDAIHLKLKEFVLNERTTAYAVNYALVNLLLSDAELAERVREIIHARPSPAGTVE